MEVEKYEMYPQTVQNMESIKNGLWQIIRNKSKTPFSIVCSEYSKEIPTSPALLFVGMLHLCNERGAGMGEGGDRGEGGELWVCG